MSVQWDVRLRTCRFRLVREWVSGRGPLFLLDADTSGTIMLCSSFSGGWWAPTQWRWGHWSSAACACDCGASTDSPLLLCLGVDSIVFGMVIWSVAHAITAVLFFIVVFFSVYYCYYFHNNKFTLKKWKQQFPLNWHIWQKIFLIVLLVPPAPVRAYISPQNQSINQSLSQSIKQASKQAIYWSITWIKLIVKQDDFNRIATSLSKIKGSYIIILFTGSLMTLVIRGALKK